MQESKIRRNPARSRKPYLGLRVAPTGGRSPPTHPSQERRLPKPRGGQRHKPGSPASLRHAPKKSRAGFAKAGPSTPGGEKVSIAEKVRRQVNLNPQIRLGLASGLTNQSALARGFLPELALSGQNFHAVLSAVKRLAEELQQPAFEDEARRVVAKSSISLKTDVAIVRLFLHAPVEKLRSSQLRIFHSVQGAAAISLVVASEGVDEFARKNCEHVLEVRKNLTEITIVSPAQIVSTAGVLLSFLSPLYSQGINAEEVLSTHTDTILLVSAQDANRAFTVLNQVITGARTLLRE